MRHRKVADALRPRPIHPWFTCGWSRGRVAATAVGIAFLLWPVLSGTLALAIGRMIRFRDEADPVLVPRAVLTGLISEGEHLVGSTH